MLLADADNAKQLPDTIADSLTNSLRPCEIGFLLRRGDRTHALVILAADVLQRALKNRLQSQPILLAPYEKSMWDYARDSVKEWTDRQKDEYLPGDLTTMKKNPVEYARKVNRLYNFLAKNVRSFASDMIKDPRNLKRYFSWAGIMRFVADFSAHGYKQAVEKELKADLIARGLLVTDFRRQKYSNYFAAAALVSLLLSLACLLAFVQPWPDALAIWLLTMLGAFAARIVFVLLEFIPLYSELSQVAAMLQRRSRRLAVLRFVIRLIVSLSVLAVVFIFILSLAIDDLILRLATGLFTIELSLVVLASTLCALASLQLAVDAFQLKYEERATAKGERLLLDVRQRLSHRTPLASFMQMLESETYDAEFSEILALYGIETLLFLA